MRRYPFGKESYDCEQLQTEVLAAGLPCVGVCGSLDAVEVLLDDTAPADALARLVPIVDAHAPDPDAPVKRRRRAAIAALLSGRPVSLDGLAAVVLAMFRDVYTRINNVNERDGLPREQETEIVGRVVAGIGGGLGDPPG